MITHKLMSLRSKEGGIFEKLIIFINELELGDKVTGTIVKLFRSQRFDGQISGALVKIGDRQSDLGFIPGHYLQACLGEKENHERKKKTRPDKKTKKQDLHSEMVCTGDILLAEVVGINPAIEAYKSEIILRPLKIVAK